MRTALRIRRPMILGVLTVCTIGLGACQTPMVQSGSEEIPHPVATIAEQEMDVFFTTDSAELTAEQLGRLEAFLDGVKPRQSSIIAIAGYADYRASERYNLALSERRVETVRRQIEALGYGDAQFETAAFGEADAAQPPVTPVVMSADRHAAVRIRVYRSVAPPCPNWSRSVTFDPQNLPSSNFGCATASNLAAMIADPRDLAEGRTLGPGDGAQAIGAIERYRTDEVKALNKELTSE